MLGTGHFALPTFQKLYDTPHQIVGLVTQPDRTGRGHHRHRNPMKEAALEHGTLVFQPENPNSTESLTRLKTLDADLFVVAAYGRILSADLLAIPRLGAINLHASLLPKYRGAAPIQYAVLNGETETGVTIFQIEPKLDAGPILSVETTPIGPKETSGELESRLATMAVSLTIRVIEQLDAGTVAETLQDAAQVSLAPRLNKDDGAIDWKKTSRAIGCHVRAMQPWPKAHSYLVQEAKPPLRVIVVDVEACDVELANDEPGTVVDVDGNRLCVQTGDGVVSIARLQPDGKRVMTVADFLRGYSVRPGDRFCSDLSAHAGE